MGVYKVTGKKIGELIHHFILGGDKTLFMAYSQITVNMVPIVYLKNTRIETVTLMHT